MILYNVKARSKPPLNAAKGERKMGFLYLLDHVNEQARARCGLRPYGSVRGPGFGTSGLVSWLY